MAHKKYPYVLVNGPQSRAFLEFDWRPYFLAVGDKVVSEFYADDATVVRTITRVEPSTKYGSGARAWADCGEVCPTCHKTSAARAIEGVDASWFKPV